VEPMGLGTQGAYVARVASRVYTQELDTLQGPERHLDDVKHEIVTLGACTARESRDVEHRKSGTSVYGHKNDRVKTGGTDSTAR
jgi:hypothetical protein